MRRIVLVLGGTDRDTKPVQAAIALARRLGAQVEGLYIKIDAAEILARFGEGIASSVSGEVLEEVLKDADAAGDKAKLLLETQARASGLTVFDKPSRQSAPGVSFRSIQGPALDVLDATTDLADLVIFGEPDNSGVTSLTAQIEYTLLTLRRPVLVARGTVDARLGDRVLVAFDGRHEACTALARALPILATSKSVEILHLCEHDYEANMGDRAIRYLAQSEIAASVIEAKPSNPEIGAEIVRFAATNDANLIVMGGYGRSRMRELVLGGATRYMTRHSPVPVLLAH